MDEDLHVDKVTTTTSYLIDGKTYASLDEMPLDVRTKVERAIVDHNKNGIPDVMEDFVVPNIGAAAIDGAKDSAGRQPNDLPPPGGDNDAGYATAGRALADPNVGSRTPPTAPTITSGGLTGLSAGGTPNAGRSRVIKLAAVAAAVIAIIVGIILVAA